MTSKPLVFFFVPGAPPTSLPLLLAQTDLSIRLPPVLAQQQIRPHHPAQAKADWVRSPPRALQPFKPTPHDPSLPPSEDISEEGSVLSDLSSLSDMEMEAEIGKIAKPIGEPGRPNRGGYNLQSAVSWSAPEFNQLKVLSMLLNLQQYLNSFRHI